MEREESVRVEIIGGWYPLSVRASNASKKDANKKRKRKEKDLEETSWLHRRKYDSECRGGKGKKRKTEGEVWGFGLAARLEKIGTKKKREKRNLGALGGLNEQLHRGAQIRKQNLLIRPRGGPLRRQVLKVTGVRNQQPF